MWLAGSGLTTGRTTWRSLLKIQMLGVVQHDGGLGPGDGLQEGVPRGSPCSGSRPLWNHPAIRSSLGTARVTHVKTTKPTASFLTQHASVNLESKGSWVKAPGTHPGGLSVLLGDPLTPPPCQSAMQRKQGTRTLHETQARQARRQLIILSSIRAVVTSTFLPLGLPPKPQWQ